MPSSSRTSLSALELEHPSNAPTNQITKAETGNTSESTEDVLETVGLINQKVNDATEPAQAIINSLAVEPDVESATKTRKRRDKKSTSTRTDTTKSKTTARSRKTTKSSRKTKTT